MKGQYFDDLLIDTSRFVLMSDGGSGDGGVAGGGSGGSNGSATGTSGDGGGGTPQPNWQSFADGLERINEGNGLLGGKLDELVRTVKDASVKPEPTPDPVDLDGLSREQFAAHILGIVQKSVEGTINTSLRPIVDAVNGIQTSTTTREVTNQIAELRSKDKGFNEWKAEMVNISKQHPTLTIPEIYALARASNPEKVAELDRKYNPPPPKQERNGFGGFATFGRSSGAGNGAAAPQSKNDAALEAYREVQSRHPTVLRALEDM